MDSSGNTNKLLQEEEIQVMFSIYQSEWQFEDLNSYSIKISNSSGNSVFFKVILPEDYPLNSPPEYLISAPWMSRELKNRLTAMLDEIYSENIGNIVLYQWVVKIQDFINGDLTKDSSYDESEDLVDYEATNVSSMPLKSACKLLDDEELPPITHGEIIQDKKSVFQGHVAKVVSADQPKKIVSKLKENKKIESATHNIYAYRISTGPDSFNENCYDDGESRAGSILLTLLKILNVKDVIVVVTRWYGGIHLGPDRFKDYKYAARNALLAAGFIQEKTKGSEKKH